MFIVYLCGSFKNVLAVLYCYKLPCEPPIKAGRAQWVVWLPKPYIYLKSRLIINAHTSASVPLMCSKNSPVCEISCFNFPTEIIVGQVVRIRTKWWFCLDPWPISDKFTRTDISMEHFWLAMRVLRLQLIWLERYSVEPVKSFVYPARPAHKSREEA